MDTVYDLPADTLKKIYLGQKKGRLLVLNFQRISSNLFRLQVRDLVFNDHVVCQLEANMSAMIPGDLIDFENPNASRSQKSRGLQYFWALSSLWHAGRKPTGTTFLSQSLSLLATSPSIRLYLPKIK